MTVPVRRYLKKYLYHIENLPYGQEIPLTKGGHIPMVLGQILTGKTSIPYNAIEVDQFEDELPIVVNARKVNDYQVLITLKKVRFFNTFLYKSFHDWLLQKVLWGKSTGATEVDVIWSVMADLEIQDDITFDALKKASYRLRLERNYPVFRQREGNSF